MILNKKRLVDSRYWLLKAGAELRPVGRVAWRSAITGEKDSAPSTNALFILKGKK